MNQGYFTQVDEEDYQRFYQWKWFVQKNKYTNYATRKEKGKKIYLHRLIFPVPEGQVVDHIDGNGLNNQKNNLKVCTQSHNLRKANLRSDNKSGYKGVYFSKEKSKWKAEISVNGKNKHLGYFSDKKEAHLAYQTFSQNYEFSS